MGNESEFNNPKQRMIGLYQQILRRGEFGGIQVREFLKTILLLALFFSQQIAWGDETVMEAWVQRYSYDSGGTSDRVLKIVADGEGNMIVIGVADYNYYGGDLLAIKYSPTGTPLWTNRYDGPLGNADWGMAGGVDSSGNVFVTGRSTSTNGSHYITFKYSSDGEPMWTNRYDGPGNNGSDTARWLAVDAGGNVLISGDSQNANNYDYATIKYSNEGVPLWTNRYNGPGNGDETINEGAVDADGNVFVTGSSVGSGTGTDFATIKYSSEGIPLWTNRYSTPRNSNDVATALAVDATGNSIVTGYAHFSGGTDYITIKYSPTGVPLWTNLYNGPGSTYDSPEALALDSSGNIFVTGSSIALGGASEYATIKYSAAGMPVWTNRYVGQARAVGVDKEDNVIVTGTTTIKYLNTGEPLWTNHYNNPLLRGFAVDPAGNALITGERLLGAADGIDWETIKYSSDGILLWTNRYNSVTKNSADEATAVAIDVSGNVLVTGYSGEIGSPRDIATIKYSSAGTAVWTNRYDGPAQSHDSPYGLASDSTGNVFVTGSSVASGTGTDYATIRYSSDGVPVWTNRYSSAGSSSDSPIALALDGSGNVFVTGSSVASATGADYATIKYSNDGIPLWTNRYSSAGSSNDSPVALALDGIGNVFVTGSSVTSGTGTDYATIKYSNDGIPLWTNRCNSTGKSNDSPVALAVDGDGNVVVCGVSFGASSDWLTVKYSGSGVPLWTNRYDGGNNGADGATALAVDSSGNVFVTGSSGSAASSDYVTIKYSGGGLPLWTNRFNGAANLQDAAVGLVVDSVGNPVVTGYSPGNSLEPNNFDYLTIKYSGAGLPLWTNRYNGPRNGRDFQRSKSLIAIGPGDSVVVSGSSESAALNSGAYDFATVKYVVVRPPEITAQPASRTNALGDTAIFTVAAKGFTTPLNFQWRKNGSNLFNGGDVPGTSEPTENSLALENVQFSDAGVYDAIISSSYGAVTSQVATLRVRPVSQVLPLPQFAGPWIYIQWAGQPTGPLRFDIYISTNGVDYEKWITNSPATAGSYRGTPGATYSFYSIARDSFGVEEIPPTNADAQTTVPLEGPVLAGLPDATIDPGQTLIFTNAVVSGTPAGEYVFSLEPGAPLHASINESNGVFRWTPTCAQASRTNLVTVRVRDSGQTNLTDTAAFKVIVRECVSPQLGRLIIPVGQTGRLPIYLVSSVPLTNLAMRLLLPETRLENPTVDTIVPELCGHSVNLITNGQYALTLTTCSNQSLIGTQQVAWLNITALLNQSSAFVWLELDEISGLQPDGSAVANFAPQGGRVVIVGAEPLLEAFREGSEQIGLVLYASLNSTNDVEQARRISGTTEWSLWGAVTMTNLAQQFVLPRTNETEFFRAIRRQ